MCLHWNVKICVEFEIFRVLFWVIQRIFEGFINTHCQQKLQYRVRNSNFQNFNFAEYFVLAEWFSFIKLKCLQTYFTRTVQCSMFKFGLQSGFSNWTSVIWDNLSQIHKSHNSRFFEIGHKWNKVYNLNSHHTSWQFLPKRSKIDFWGTKHPWILKIPPKTPPKIKFCIFWCYKRKPEMKFSKFCTPEVDRKFIFRLVWVIFVWHEESS